MSNRPQETRADLLARLYAVILSWDLPEQAEPLETWQAGEVDAEARVALAGGVQA